jgi:nucleoside-diphosphate-sugar epimerase
MFPQRPHGKLSLMRTDSDKRLVLITGGAGFLGINLCRYLLSRGYAVRSLDIAAFDYPEQSRVDVIRGDIRDCDTVAHAMRDVDFVVHAAAALPLSSPEEIRSTDVHGTAIVLQGAAYANVARLVFTSSTSVYGVPHRHPLYEDDPVQGVGPYGEAKIQAERLCQEQRASGACVSTLRPKSFVGPERLGIFELLYDFAFQGRNFPVLGSGKNRYQLLDVEDVCQAILLCLEKDRNQVNGTFNVGAQVFGTLRQSFQAVLDRAGHGKHVVSLPAAPAIAVLRALEWLGLSPIYPWIYDTCGRESYVSVERIERQLGFKALYSNEQALIRNYDWYVRHRDEIRGKGQTGVTHRVPWKRGALAVAAHFF